MQDGRNVRLVHKVGHHFLIPKILPTFWQFDRRKRFVHELVRDRLLDHDIAIAIQRFFIFVRKVAWPPCHVNFL